MKTSTRDEHIHSVCKVILYIEQNYHYDLNLEQLSKIASFSAYHFHRIFQAIMAETLSEYIRRVRLQSTTLKFKTNQRVTQIAQSSGYETNASFSKAFKNHFGISPKEFSKNAKVQEVNEMLEPKIIELKEVEILYVRKEGDYTVSASKAWEGLMQFAYRNKIKYKKNLMGKSAMMFGIGHDDPNVTDTNKLRYDACITWDDKTVKPEGEILNKTIEGGKYAMFLHKGSYENLKPLYDEIGNWIVQSGIDLRDLPLFEKYYNRDPRRTKAENLKTEIYVPIR